MDPVKRALNSSVNFVRDHKLPIAIAATAVTTAVVVKKVTGDQLDAAMTFIGEKGLMGEFEHHFENVID